MKTPRTFETGGRFNVVADAPRCPRAEPNTSSELRELPSPNVVADAERDTLETARAVNPQTAKE